MNAQKCHRHKLQGNYGNSQVLVDLEYSKTREYSSSMTTIDYCIPFVFDSGAPSARDKTDDGSGFTIYLETPLVIPYNAAYCYIDIHDIICWNNVPNITLGVDSDIYIELGFLRNVLKSCVDKMYSGNVI